MKKRLIFALLLLVLLSTYKPQKLFLSTQLNIDEIQIENNFILKEEVLTDDKKTSVTMNFYSKKL